MVEKETMTCGINHPKLLVWNVGIHDHRPIYEVSVLRPIPFAWAVSRPAAVSYIWVFFLSCVCGLVWQAPSLTKSADPARPGPLRGRKVKQTFM